MSNPSQFAVAAGLQPPPVPHEEHPTVVCATIESLVFSFAQSVLRDETAAGTFHLLSRAPGAQRRDGAGVLRPGDATQRRPFAARTAVPAARMLRVLAAAHALLRARRRASQRELFYQLVALFPSQLVLNNVVLDVSALLCVPRCALGVDAATRGVLAGSVEVALTGSVSKVDCAHVGTNGWPIPGDVRAASSVILSSSARYILVIEKFGIFSQLVQDRLFERVPCVLLCGKGYPSIATRAMASLLEKRLRVPVIGIADFNPHGLALLHCYKYGSARSNLEGQHFTCNVNWLGLRSKHIREHAAAIGLCGEPLRRSDEQVLRRLQQTAAERRDAGVRAELAEMRRLGKYELQWLYGTPGGTRFLANGFVDRAMLQKDFVPLR